MVSPSDPSPADGVTAPTQAIIKAIAAREGVDVTDIEPPAYDPLYTVVNPEALDSLFETPAAGSSIEAHIALEYEGYEVIVGSDGTVEVNELSAAGSEDSTDTTFEHSLRD